MEWKKNDEIVLVMDDLGKDGEGIGHVDGYTLFVKDALPGEEVRVRLTRLNKHYGFARLLEILKPSPDRRTPPCAAAHICGGCSLQHLTSRAQLAYKEKKIRDCLVRLGGVDETQAEWLPIQGMETPWQYRNKAQFPVRPNKEGLPVAGFFARHSHRLVPTESCQIQHPAINAVTACILAFMREFHIPAYREGEHVGLVRHIYVRRGFATGQIMVCLVINGDCIPHQDEMATRLWTIPGMASLCLNINCQKTNVILSSRFVFLRGPSHIEDNIGGIRYRISPQSFYQVNPLQTKMLYDMALSFADLQGSETVWDLYCGIGTISLYVAARLDKSRGGSVIGVEIVPEAVENAVENARLNGITNARFYCGAAEVVVPELVARKTERMDVVIVDPPRKGCGQALLDTIARMSPDKIVYVSCDPATLARDVGTLGKTGYEVRKVQGCDMFPQGGHVETIVGLQRQGMNASLRDTSKSLNLRTL